MWAGQGLNPKRTKALRASTCLRQPESEDPEALSAVDPLHAQAKKEMRLSKMKSHRLSEGQQSSRRGDLNERAQSSRPSALKLCSVKGQFDM